MTQTGTTTPGQSEPESNGNEGALHTSQSFRSRALLSDFSLVSYTRQLLIFVFLFIFYFLFIFVVVWGLIHSAGDTVSVFYAQPSGWNKGLEKRKTFNSP